MSFCPPPRCHRTKRGCRCPNPWIEFVAKTSKEHRDRGLKSLTRSQMSVRYRRSKKAKLFDPKKDGIFQRCRSDTELLCRWNADRQKRVVKNGRPNTGKKELEINASSRVESLLPNYSLDERNDVPCDSRAEVRTAFVKKWFPKIVELLPNFKFQFFAKGLNDELILFREKKTRAYLLVRLMNMNDCKVPQEQAFAAQKFFESKLGKLVPRVHFGYILDDNRNERVRIFGMDPVQGTVDRLLLDPHARDMISKMKLARKVKDILQTLKAKKLQHGDLSFQNISYKLDSSGEIERLGLIDFEYSIHLMDPYDDTEGILCDAWSYGLLPFMEKVGIPISEWIHRAVSSGKDPREENPHHGESFTFRSPFKALRLPILLLK